MLRLLLVESSGVPRFWWLQFPYSDKLVHAGVFAVGSLLLTLGMRPWTRNAVMTTVVLWGISLAVLTESYQSCCLETRSGEWSDLLSDLLGTALPLVVGLWRRD